MKLVVRLLHLIIGLKMHDWISLLRLLFIETFQPHMVDYDIVTAFQKANETLLNHASGIPKHASQ